MKKEIVFAVTIALSGCSTDATHLLNVGESCIIKSPASQVTLIRYATNGLSLKCEKDGSVVFDAVIEEDLIVSSHWVPAGAGEDHADLMQISSDGRQFLDFTSSFTTTNGTVEVYDLDGDGYPDKRHTSRPDSERDETIRLQFITDSYTYKTSTSAPPNPSVEKTDKYKQKDNPPNPAGEKKTPEHIKSRR